MGRTLDMDVFSDLAGSFVELDFETYAETLRCLGEHDACDQVDQVQCPGLVITGDRDIMTPVSTARHIQSRMKDCSMVVIESATHYAAVEFPQRVISSVEEFLQRVDY